MTKKVLMWLIIGMIGLYLVFRPFTPFWLDMLVISIGLPIFIWTKFLPKDKAKEEQSEKQTPP